MATTSSQPITFIVPGEAQSVSAAATRGAGPTPLPSALPQGKVKQSVRIGTQRGGGGEVRMSAVPGEDMVVLEIANGPTLTLHPASARDLMLAQSAARKRGANGKPSASPDQAEVPVELQWDGLEEDVVARGATRGFLGRVLLKAVHVVTGDRVVDLAASKVVERVDAQVAAGVYRLKPDVLPKLKGSGALLPAVPAAKDGKPILILIHGTFSNTQGTFGKLWTQHPDRVKTLFDHYDQRVYALDHPTLGESPITNAGTLVRALPKGAHLHLVTHSRGGLVAEVLARICAKPDLAPEELGLFKGDKYKAQRADLQALAQLVKKKELHVDRVVRVACPARGTLLASKRLDAYISVFKWTLELAGVPVAPELVEFLGQVAQERTDPEVIPGLAAQIPDSPLVQWLHAVDEAVPGELRVVAGDIQGDSVVSWLKTLLSDAFYWSDNDLVVQTRSMYGGAPRAVGAGFVLDQGGGVSHFNYFTNERTAAAIVEALTLETPPAFRPIGPRSWAGESSSGIRAARRAAVDDKPPGDKPAVFLLPGILGSNLKVDGKRIWLGWRMINGLKRLTYKPHGPERVEPDGPIDMVYDDLGDFLSRTHEVIEFGFDWRRPIEDEARRLAGAVTRALDARATSGQPVRLLAHSMGGVLARTMQLEEPATWRRMISQPKARVLMLGTPNGGSWAPMQVLSADDTFGNALVAFGAPFQDRAARELMANFPGFIQLQAGLLDQRLNLDRNETWRKLAEEDLQRLRERSWWHRLDLQLGAYAWGVPPQDVLDRAVSLRRKLDGQSDKDLVPAKDAVVLVVGKARFTPDGYEIGDEGLVYLDAQDHGDGRVTLSSAQLPGIRTWQFDCAHGELPDKKEAFQAYLDLLETGTTDRLRVVAMATRGAAASVSAVGPVMGRVKSRPSRTRAPSRPPENEGDVLRGADDGIREVSPPSEMALGITVHNGDLAFIHEPLMIGHYRSILLTGTERVMNDLVGKALQHSLEAGLYPDPVGTHQVFVNTQVPPDDPRHLPRPEAVIVVGLGAEGKLRSSELVQTVRQGVIAWAQRVAERPGVMPPLFDLAATLIGSGGSNMSVGQSARLIAQGVREANLHLRTVGWPRVGHLQLIELYLDRAVEAWRALQIQAETARSYYTVTPEVRSGPGALLRPIDTGYRGADYDFFSAITEGGADGRIEYVLDTRRARNEVRDHSTQASLIRGLVEKASNDQNSDPQFGRTLCQLLIPLTMDTFLGGATELLIELDGGTAGIPWELLDTDPADGGDHRPWAIRAKLLRRLRTPEFREQVNDAGLEASVLVIGEPQCDSRIYPLLPGAREEAIAVARSFTSREGFAADRVKLLVGSRADGKDRPDAHAVINALFERKTGRGGRRSWRIVHIAGHGEPPEPPDPSDKKSRDPRGVVLSDGAFLGPREVNSLRVVPELVFVNCCYLGAGDRDQLLRQRELGRGGPYDRVTFASGLAQKLIEIGVRCVVAAGWAVDDGPAKTFATTFYECLLKGQRFMDAVAEAREAAYAEGGNTWAAYQCYGDPDWTLRREGSDAQQSHRPLTGEFSAVASPIGLTIALRTLAVQSEFQKRPADTQRAKVNHLEARFGKLWGGIGHVAEAFGRAWAAIQDRAKAIEWYRRAMAANDGSASLKAMEQLGNFMARDAWEKVGKARDRRDALERRLRKLPRGRSPASAAARRQASREVAAAGRELRAEGRKAGRPMRGALELLQKLVVLEPTIERESLLGSAYKRQAMIATAAGLRQQVAPALKRMQKHYRKAADLAVAHQPDEVFYPGLNLMAAELVLSPSRGTFKGFDPVLLVSVKESLDGKIKGDHDFWSAAGVPDLMLYEALAAGKLAASLTRIMDAYEDLHRRVDAKWMWASVYDQARFVLPRYAAKASEREQRGVESLLEQVGAFATSEPPEREAAPTPTTPTGTRRAPRRGKR